MYEGPVSSPQATKDSVGLHLSPAVFHLIANHHLDPTSIKGTGKSGRLLKGDVLAAIQNGTAKTLSATPIPTTLTPSPSPSPPPSPSPSPSSQAPTHTTTSQGSLRGRQRSYRDIPHSNMRKVIATRLTQSKTTIPHAYMTIECQLDNVLALRQRFKNENNVSISVNDIVIRAASLALRDVPDANVIFDPKTNQAVIAPQIDISVAVATENGLITPIVKNANKKYLQAIAADVKELANRARQGKLKPNEFQGGSFTISNLGMFGITEFSAVINPPQACILAVSGSQSRLTSSPSSSSSPSPTTFMSVTLSWDVRALDELVAGRFLERFQNFIESPVLMLQ